ncbi:pectin lyase fold/virulence factor [Syncephalastrum racemosum]|uniref:pectinesterase n=1 Tax=Syncephalastrum racemosum TaxID=13706 RepID=A0A1X2HVA8_SYNRA|nr:pectin lyase fold/virulence factor [Syncephalastrum racemosum]
MFISKFCQKLIWAATLIFFLGHASAAVTVKVSVGESIQSALDSLSDDGSQAIVEIESGVYKENITISRSNIIFRPSNAGQVTLTKSVENYAVVYIEQKAENLSFYDFVIINSIGEAAGNQNALRSYAPKLALYNCKIVGFGDTAWLSTGSGFFYNTWIEGTVDFIYGQADLYFLKSTIACSGQGAITAAAHLATDKKGGFVFNQCTFKPVISTIYKKRQENDHSYTNPLSSAEYAQSTILGRPWHNSPRVFFLKSTIGSHVKPAGYDAWHFTSEELKDNTYYAEYGNTGGGAGMSDRVSWVHKISSAEAAPYLSAKTFFNQLNLGTDWIDSSYLN